MDKEKLSCIWVNIRELDGVPSTKLSTTLPLAYSKELYVILKINIYRICYITLFSFKIFYDVLL